MNISPIDNQKVGSPSSDDVQKFDAAVEQAGQELSDSEFSDLLLEGAVSAAAPMLIMPKVNEILSEAMSDD